MIIRIDVTHKKYIIIGNSAAGVAAIRTLRSLDQQADIICVSDERETPYNKCFLADYLAGHKSREQTYTMTQEQLVQLRINMKLGVRVRAINAKERYVTYADGSTDSYDKLLLATGRRPRQHPLLMHRQYANLFQFHSLHHAQQLFTYIQEHHPKTALVIGAGLSGVEVADALAQHKIQVHIVEQSPQLLTHLLTVAGSTVLEQIMQQQGVQIHTGKSITSLQGDKQIKEVHLSDGPVIRPDIVISAIGTVPNDELIISAGLQQDMFGVTVDQYLNSSNEHIYAAGDMISIVDQLSGRRMASCTWPDAMQQGRYAAMAMAGQPKSYPGAAIIASSAFFGLKFYSCGPKDLPGCTIIEQNSNNNSSYNRYVIDQEGLLKGFILLNDGTRFATLKQALLTKTLLKADFFIS